GGVSWLRPTVGFVPRSGATALSWTMDKIGASCRAVEEFALVLSGRYGPDGHEGPVKDTAIRWDGQFDRKQPRVGHQQSAFDELTRSGRDKLLTGQKIFDWPNQFRVARFYSAVDYVQAQRARTLGMEATAKMFADVDVIVTPSGGAQLTATNLTGHPAVIV